ncbi:hypothetical protein CHS0354_001941 [Potamilus streckersoni]|uniref:mannitol 2-dehydrogenase n=1 Tax=Potamilus streckersoni TaxID=2493646 RepID=A0AAE0T5H5_9BIVA|nr:hypothetical protein CHS0354_001941 [Potamilus streckersoni]
MGLTAFKTELDAISVPPLLFFSPTLENFEIVQERSNYLHYAMNSIVISAGATLLALLIAVPAAFTFAFDKKPYYKDLILWMLSTKMLPAVGVLVPIYIIFKEAGLLDTRVALIIIYTLINLPIAVWMMFSYFKEVPFQIVEAARIDGVGLFDEIRYIVCRWREASGSDDCRLFQSGRAVLVKTVGGISSGSCTDCRTRLVQSETVGAGINFRSVRLSRGTLAGIRGVEKPDYNPADITPGILHISPGGLSAPADADRRRKDWGIINVFIRPEVLPLYRAMKSQDGLYTLVTAGSQNQRRQEIIGSVVMAVDAHHAPQESDRLFCDPRIRIVTATVTEGGYYLTADGSDIDVKHLDIAGDIKGGRNTLYAYLRYGLKARMDSGGEPLTAATCDNMRHNGAMLKKGFMAFLKHCGEDALSAWTAENVAFPSAMVDRITPKSDPALCDEIERTYDYIQWVMEDNFINGRPPLEKVGVQMVSDVSDYEETKIRIINGGHCALAYFAALKGYRFFHEGMDDKALRAFIEDYTFSEVIPTLDKVKLDVKAYAELVFDRFSNRYAPDKIQRLAAEGVSRIPKFVIPVISDRMKRSQATVRGFEILASWFMVLKKDRAGMLGYKYADQENARIDGWFSALNPFEAFAADYEMWDIDPALHSTFTQQLTDTYNRLCIAY